MKRRSAAISMGMLVAATACSSILGIESNSQLVSCTSDSECPGGSCIDHHCQFPSSDAASNGTGGAPSGGGSALGAGTGGSGGSTLGLATGGSGNGGGATGGSSSVDAGECTPGSHQCTVSAAGSFAVAWQTCDKAGNWDGEVPDVFCPGHCSERENGCAEAPSCNDITANCPLPLNINCCNSLPLPAGTFDRSSTINATDNTCATPNACPATVSAFLLDTFEVTVGRFRAFVGDYPGNVSNLKSGTGRNINNTDDTGWDTSWLANIPSSQADLVTSLQSCPKSTYTTNVASNEFLSINCVNWYLAYAFCAWDGGRLPTEAEWDYAASGTENRVYPWSNPPSQTSPLTKDYANFASADNPGAPEAVGTAYLGQGRWGQLDLAGNVSEWLVDAPGATYADPTTCQNCANLSWVAPQQRINHGGSYISNNISIMVSYRATASANSLWDFIGLRCARNL